MSKRFGAESWSKMASGEGSGGAGRGISSPAASDHGLNRAGSGLHFDLDVNDKTLQFQLVLRFFTRIPVAGKGDRPD